MANKKEVVLPPVLFWQTQEIIKEIEDKLGAPLITYYNSSAG